METPARHAASNTISITPGIMPQMLVTVDVGGRYTGIEDAGDLSANLRPNLVRPEPPERVRLDPRGVRIGQPSVLAAHRSNVTHRTDAALIHQADVYPNTKAGIVACDTHCVIKGRAVRHEAGATEYSLTIRRLDPAIDPFAQAKVVCVHH